MEEYGKETFSQYCGWQYLPGLFAVLFFISGVVALCAGGVLFAESDPVLAAASPAKGGNAADLASEAGPRSAHDTFSEEALSKFQPGSKVLNGLGIELPAEFHPWGNFELGAWNFSRILIESRRRIHGSSKTVLEVNSSLHEKRTDFFSSLTESYLLLAGKSIQKRPKTVSSDFLGLSPFEVHRAEELAPAALEVEGQSILCRVVKVYSEGSEFRRETLFWINETTLPYLFRKERTTWRGRAAQPCETVKQWVTLRNVQFSFLGKVLNGYQYSIRGEYPTYISTSEVVASFSVPGRIVTQVTHETDLNGRPLQDISRELLDFGTTSRVCSHDISKSSVRTGRLIIMPEQKGEAGQTQDPAELSGSEDRKGASTALSASVSDGLGQDAENGAKAEDADLRKGVAPAESLPAKRRLFVVEFSAETDIGQGTKSGGGQECANGLPGSPSGEFIPGFLPEVSLGHLNSLDLMNGMRDLECADPNEAEAGNGLALPIFTSDSTFLKKFRARWQFGKELQGLEGPVELKSIFPHLQFECWQERSSEVPGESPKRIRTLSPIYDKNLRDRGRETGEMQEEDESAESEMTEGVPSRHGSSREIPEWKPLVREFRPRIISTQALREEARPEPQEAGKPQKKKASSVSYRPLFPILQRILFD